MRGISYDFLVYFDLRIRMDVEWLDSNKEIADFSFLIVYLKDANSSAPGA